MLQLSDHQTTLCEKFLTPKTFHVTITWQTDYFVWQSSSHQTTWCAAEFWNTISNLAMIGQSVNLLLSSIQWCYIFSASFSWGLCSTKRRTWEKVKNYPNLKFKWLFISMEVFKFIDVLFVIVLVCLYFVFVSCMVCLFVILVACYCIIVLVS